MLIQVSHVTTYRYVDPVRSAVQSLRLTPSQFEGQRVLDWSISVVGGVRGGAFRDGAGDWIEGWSVRGPMSEIVVRVEGKVETKDMAGMLRGHREIVPPSVYLRETVPTRADAALAEIGNEACDGSVDPLDAAHQMTGLIADAIAYRPGATHAHTTAADALARGEGVCQDHAHALIAAARSVRMPARYVSGYLLSDAEGQPHEASHAWAEIWLDALGWVGFDPTNRLCPNEKYIRLGSGLDARDAAPIRGVANGTAQENLDVTVAVRAAQQ